MVDVFDRRRRRTISWTRSPLSHEARIVKTLLSYDNERRSVCIHMEKGNISRLHVSLPFHRGTVASFTPRGNFAGCRRFMGSMARTIFGASQLIFAPRIRRERELSVIRNHLLALLFGLLPFTRRNRNIPYFNIY